MRPVVGMYSFFSTDPRRLAEFWAGLMQLPTAPEPSDEVVMLDLHHEVAPQTWIFERTDEPVTGTNPLGLDIGAEDADAWHEVAERAEALGAERVADREESGVRWIEMRDPDGNRFRVFGPRPR
ncbi:hypothetical protein SGUI_1443 [Serinicoccus hydrothermalis]|uniref:Glyoxalase-like domain-containing protein n=1 Tax=Serinicoccus hydrothermalis TaxID=1758689 RepID=A0A1B1NBL8_9MICO|nr:hypothetical protein SGUI_1443 [Serinicoccus hydrothermalis]